MTPPLHLPLPSRTRRSNSGPAVRALVVGAVTVSLALLGGCGDDKAGNADKSPSPTASASAPPSTSASPTPSPSPTPTIKPSSNLDALKVSGDFGKAPKLSFKDKDPWAINKTQSKVLKKGNGPKIQADGTVAVNYSAWVGRTGKEFDSSYDKKFKHQELAYFPLTGVIPGFKKGLQGHRVGDRVLIAMASKDGYDGSGGNAQAGINVGDSLVFIADVAMTTLESAEGESVKPPSGLPAVAVKGDNPTVTIPSSEAPTKTTVQPLIKGTGPKVKATDNVTTRSETVLWKDGKVVDDGWKTPFTPQADPTTGQLTPTRLKAMQAAMVGQPMGSRLLVVFPPGKAYPNGDKSQGITKDDTVVMVVDILFTQPAQ